MTGQLLCVLCTVVLIVMVGIAASLRIVPEYQRLVVFRRGRALDKPKGPGFVFLIPFLDRTKGIDMRELGCEGPQDTATTKDHKPVTFAIRWDYKVLDPVKCALKRGGCEIATSGVAITKIRELVHEIISADLASERERISYMTNSYLDEITGRWGIKVTNFEITDIFVDNQNK